MEQKLFKVHCRTCNQVIGKDIEVKFIEKCSFCLRPKRKKKGQNDIQTASSSFARVKKGPASDLPEQYRHYTFRSGWERNFARVLCAKNLTWTYEERVFQFSGVARRPFQYIPDFYTAEDDTWWEVKGYMIGADKLKMQRMKKQYPDDFKKLKACLSSKNKAAVAFYGKMGIPMIFIDELKTEWEDKVNWE